MVEGGWPGGRALDVSAFFGSSGGDFGEAFFAENGPALLAEWLDSHAHDCPSVDPGARLGCCVARPSKIVCIGLNYRDHARESGLPEPAEPVVFFKASSACSGPFDDIVLPREGSKVDWEVELAFVVGRQAQYVTEEEALAHVAGYALHNDLSERTWQLERGGQWVKGKSFDTFAPLGPWLVTPDEIPDPHDLRLWLSVNDERLQDGTTGDLLFGLPTLVSYLSRFMTLLPGDVVSTGTPAGVGLGLTPPRYLRAGDSVELGADGLGVARQRVVDSRS
jgi:2-keto-4-pentenoate hydratase/2-oxohepta-3-ene-1,7-dioic acid hydratase in catechol pathway